jgi:acetate kinase
VNAVTETILTLNAGSSSIKFALYDAAGDLTQLAAGQVEGIGAEPRLRVKAHGGTEAVDRPLSGLDHAGAIEGVLAWLDGAFAGLRIDAVGHRVVHGGIRFTAPAVITPSVLRELEALVPLAPLHQPHNIAGIEAAAVAFPGVPQVACFDTAFHRTHPFTADVYAVPRRLYDDGVRRYGFHGLSYEFIAGRLRQIAPIEAAGRTIVAHLGNGASMCALRDGRSIASTMGFTALDGLPMGTRCGQLDPGVVLYLMAARGMGADEISAMLYHESGLKGLSELSNDMRVLEASDDPKSRDAVAYFVAAIQRAAGSLAAALRGLDAIVFTGGIGENSRRIRQSVLEGLDWLGVTVDPTANERGTQVISAPGSGVKVFVLKTDEEQMIARHTRATAGVTSMAAE